MVTTTELPIVCEALKKVSGVYRNKKEVVEIANQYLSRPLSYNEWRHLWQTNQQIAALIDEKIKKVQHQTKLMQGTIWGVGDSLPVPTETPTIVGVTASDQMPDKFETIEKLRAYFQKVSETELRKRTQKITFNKGPICIVNSADHHFGGAIDMDWVFADLDLIRSTPGMYINFVGDLTNNFIGHWTKKINHNRYVTIEEEHVLSKTYMEMALPRLIAVCAGNHDNWSIHESGLDVLKLMLNELGSTAIYDIFENYFTVEVEGFEVTFRSRHKWLGYSERNPTHAIEKAALNDGNFDVGVGAHTHVSALTREFNNRGKLGMAVQCGTYKLHDPFAREMGFPLSNGRAAACVIIDPKSSHGIIGTSDLIFAANYMRKAYQ